MQYYDITKAFWVLILLTYLVNDSCNSNINKLTHIYLHIYIYIYNSIYLVISINHWTNQDISFNFNNKAMVDLFNS